MRGDRVTRRGIERPNRGVQLWQNSLRLPRRQRLARVRDGIEIVGEEGLQSGIILELPEGIALRRRRRIRRRRHRSRRPF